MADSEQVRAGLRFLQDRQEVDGSWPDETIAGVFNKTCAITYDNYRKIFGLWALAAAEARLKSAAKDEGMA
jgi:lanosterol synthase